MTLSQFLLYYCIFSWVFGAYIVQKKLPELVDDLEKELPPMLPNQYLIVKVAVVDFCLILTVIAPVWMPGELWRRAVILKRKWKSRYHFWRIKRTLNKVANGKSKDEIDNSLDQLAVTVDKHFDKMM